ncbi:hypothetical protein LCM28_09910 [Salipiger pacificus]|nr:hypothetical protein [Alloyangia pacifica]
MNLAAKEGTKAQERLAEISQSLAETDLVMKACQRELRALEAAIEAIDTGVLTGARPHPLAELAASAHAAAAFIRSASPDHTLTDRLDETKDILQRAHDAMQTNLETAQRQREKVVGIRLRAIKAVFSHTDDLMGAIEKHMHELPPDWQEAISEALAAGPLAEVTRDPWSKSSAGLRAGLLQDHLRFLQDHEADQRRTKIQRAAADVVRQSKISELKEATNV